MDWAGDCGWVCGNYHGLRNTGSGKSFPSERALPQTLTLRGDAEPSPWEEALAVNEAVVVGGFDEIFGDVTGETVPTVPTHGRRESQTVFQGARGWDAKKRSEEQRYRETTSYFFRKTLHENPLDSFSFC